MRRIKNISRFIFIIAFLLISALIPGTQSKASGYNGVYYGSVSDLKQTGYWRNGADISWISDDADTSGFNIYVGVYGDTGILWSLQGTSSVTSYRLNHLESGKKYCVKVEPFNVEGNTGYSEQIDVKTVPAAVTGFRQDKWWKYAKILDVAWDGIETADSLEIILYNSRGKRVDSKKVSGWSTRVGFSNIKNEVYTVKIRAAMDGNGTQYYSDVASILCFTQADVRSVSNRNGKLTIKWNKVGGATGYDIYVSTRQHSGYKKVKSVGKATNKVSITRIKGKRISSKKTYYVYVETKKKSGKQVNKSGHVYCWNSKTNSEDYI